MPTIVMISPKGGAGKTTSALILSCELARATSVTLVDADPNRPMAEWAKSGHSPPNLRIVSDGDERNIISKIRQAATETAFVVVDLEGTASKIVLMAASQADLVIIPTQGSQLDARQAGRAVDVINESDQMTGRKTPYLVLRTRTNPAYRTRNMSFIAQAFDEADIPTFRTEMNEREAFKAVFGFGVRLDQLGPKEAPNSDKARANAEAFAQEVVETLRALNNAKAA